MSSITRATTPAVPEPQPETWSNCLVAGGIACDELRAKAGTTTTDVRERGDRRYDVMIGWDCTDLRVIVRAPDGRIGTSRTPRPECCGTP